MDLGPLSRSVFSRSRIALRLFVVVDEIEHLALKAVEIARQLSNMVEPFFRPPKLQYLTSHKDRCSSSRTRHQIEFSRFFGQCERVSRLLRSGSPPIL